MDTMVEVRIDQQRGCGWRKPGGLYLVSDEINGACGKLPLPLNICPCCGGGIKFSRGYTWVSPSRLFEGRECMNIGQVCSAQCPLHTPPDSAGLLWVGEKFYPTTRVFRQEAAQLGVSRRVKSLPHRFIVGETLVLLAHKKCFKHETPDGVVYGSGIFAAFRPKRVEYVTNGNESDEELERLVRRGITPVQVMRNERTDDGTAQE